MNQPNATRRGDCTVCKTAIDMVFTGIVTGIAAEQRRRLLDAPCDGYILPDASDEIEWCSVCQHEVLAPHGPHMTNANAIHASFTRETQLLSERRAGRRRK